MIQPTVADRLARNLRHVRETLASACAKAGRAPGDVRLVGVTKYVGAELIAALRDAGVRDLGENRAQQLIRRAGELDRNPLDLDTPAPGRIRWHMIGHLQRNKVRRLLGVCRVIHSLDSARLAEEIERQASELGAAVDVLVEVNVSGELSKGGIAPGELPALAAQLVGCPHLRLRGLMTMAPLSDDPEDARPHFARLRELREAMRKAGDLPADCRELSMGMTGDYAVAVEEGATIVRIGSALFEGLPSAEDAAPHAGH